MGGFLQKFETILFFLFLIFPPWIIIFSKVVDVIYFFKEIMIEESDLRKFSGCKIAPIWCKSNEHSIWAVINHPLSLFCRSQELKDWPRRDTPLCIMYVKNNDFG